jgi:DNA ligase-associated metallophosphoesterase
LIERELEVNGEGLALDPLGALFWPAERTLVFADLHFEKGSAYAPSGQMLPPYDTRTTLKRIAALVAHYAPMRIIALGDSFHDRAAADRLDVEERTLLASLAQNRDWIWIAGNHDPTPPSWLSGSVCEEAAIGALVFRHEPAGSRAEGEIAGHLHPCKSFTRRGASVRRRCFVSDGARMVMPAFGAYTGGLDVRDRAVRQLFGADFLAYVLGTQRIYAVAA